MDVDAFVGIIGTGGLHQDYFLEPAAQAQGDYGRNQGVPTLVAGTIAALRLEWGRR